RRRQPPWRSGKVSFRAPVRAWIYYRPMNAHLIFAGLLALATASAAVADDPADCLPVVEEQWVRAAPPGAKTLAGYLVLRNPCAAPVVVVDVESLDFGMPMIHRTVEEGGMSRMREAGRLELPPG